jgi:hypothetical protein
LTLQCKQMTKYVFRPFHAMQCLFRKHLQRAVRNLSVVFRVILTSIRFCLIWNDNLNMPFRSKSATVNQWNSCSHTLCINV